MSSPPTFHDIRFVDAQYTVQLPGRDKNNKVIIPSRHALSLFSNGIGLECMTFRDTKGLPNCMYEHAFRMDQADFNRSRFIVAAVDLQRDPVTGELLLLPNKKIMGEFMATNGGSHDGSDCITNGLAYINDIPPTVLASVLRHEGLSKASRRPTCEFDCVKNSSGKVILFPLSARNKITLGRASVMLDGPAPSG